MSDHDHDHESEPNNASSMETGSGNHGCSHYKRKCKIRAPCCNEIFDCRHCHNEAKNSMEIDPLNRHDVPRHEIKKVICSLCETEQEIQQYCKKCKVCFGNYFCAKCNFFDDDISKKQYHCDECGICSFALTEPEAKRISFIVRNAPVVIRTEIKETHRCVERAMHHDCPVCFEYLFDTTRDITVLTCGHTMHFECLKEMELRYRYTCPICSKSLCDMSSLWRKLDEEIASTPMPELYKNKKVWILCNDCGSNCHVPYHVVAHKCLRCKSYNTRQTRGAGADVPSLPSGVAELLLLPSQSMKIRILWTLLLWP